MNDNISHNKNRIKFEKHLRGNEPYWVDANGLLKGEWLAYREIEEKGNESQTIYMIIKKSFKYSYIDEFGFFYDRSTKKRFLNKKYDYIYYSGDGVFICEKNNKYGLIDKNENELTPTEFDSLSCTLDNNVYLCEINNRYGLIDGKGNKLIPAYYNKIEQTTNGPFIITSEKGKFLYNALDSKQSKIYTEIVPTSDSEYFVFEQDGKYGLLNYFGEVALKSLYSKEELKSYYSDSSAPILQFCIDKKPYNLYYDYKNIRYRLYLGYKRMFYNLIPIKEYDACFRIYHSESNIYITQKDGKYGILNHYQQVVSKPVLDDIILYNGQHVIAHYSTGSGRFINASFVIAIENGYYKLYDTNTCKCIIEHCEIIDYIDYRIENHSSFFFQYKKGNESGLITAAEKFIDYSEYKIKKFSKGDIYVTKNDKEGVLDLEGEMRLPCIYDDIQTLNIRKYRVRKDGVEEIIDLWPEREDYMVMHQSYRNHYEPRHYSKYNGAYGLSDEEIDTVFEGDPSAYWNID